MDGEELISLARQLYVDQLVDFLGSQFATFPAGSAETPTRRDGERQLYGGQFRADFLVSPEKDGDAPQVAELIPDEQLEFDPIEGEVGDTEIRIERLNWDDVEIVHDIAGDLMPRLGDWFAHWYDPDERRIAPGATEPPEVIHALRIYPDRLVIDFGTAPTDAFWDLVEILSEAGAERLAIRATRKLPREQAN